MIFFTIDNGVGAVELCGESGVVTANGKIEMKIYNDSDDTAQIPYTQELRAVDGGYELKLVMDPSPR